MKKKLIFIFCAAAVCCGMYACLHAQRASEDQPFITIMLQHFNQLEDKIDKLASAAPAVKPDAGSREILAKLDQVIAGQQKIMQELEVVKVRATRK